MNKRINLHVYTEQGGVVIGYDMNPSEASVRVTPEELELLLLWLKEAQEELAREADA